MTDLLQGLELDRAIAERKGWTVYTGFNNPCTFPHLTMIGEDIWYVQDAYNRGVWRPHDDPALALGLLEEIMNECPRVVLGRCGGRTWEVYFDPWVDDVDTWLGRFGQLYHEELGVVVGNAWLQWKEGQ